MKSKTEAVIRAIVKSHSELIILICACMIRMGTFSLSATLNGFHLILQIKYFL